MSTTTQQWRVLGHGPIEHLTENLWWVQGDLPKMSLKRVMTVARLDDSGLVIHNAIALEEARMRELEAWGTPKYLLVPSAMHRLDAPLYKQRYPELRVLAPRGSRSKVQQVVAVDGTYEDFPARQDVRLITLTGMAAVEGVMLVKSADGISVVLNDVVFNMDRKRDLLGYLITTLLGSAPGPRISRLVKWLLIKDRNALKCELAELAETPQLQRLIVAHEKVASGADAKQALQAALTYL